LRFKVISLSFETFSHATEDLNKVLETLMKFIPPEVLKHIKVSRATLSGHYKNPIEILRINITRSDLIDSTIKKLASMINDSDKRRLAFEVGRRLDKTGRFYIRFDKQQAYLGNFLISDKGDSIKVIISISPRPKDEKSVSQFLKKLGLIITSEQ